MKQILVISGKGGTGKTTVAGALADHASRSKRVVLADADVDAANLELLLEPEIQETFHFMAGKTLEIDTDACTQCGKCQQVCRFDAIDLNEAGQFTINASMCEGCLSCTHQCPADAIQVTERVSGEWYRSNTPYGTLFHANLFPGEENSGKLVTQIKSDARKFASESHADLLLIDGPPGIGCPVTAACQGVDAAIIVSEPTVSGIHDMKRVKQVTDFFHIPAYLILNKADLNPDIKDDFMRFSSEMHVPLLGEIPYNEAIMHAQANGKPISQSKDGAISHCFYSLWESVRTII